MLKRLWFALVVSLLSVGLVNVAMATVLNVGIGNPIDSEAGQFGIHFKKLIEERTNGKVKVE